MTLEAALAAVLLLCAGFIAGTLFEHLRRGGSRYWQQQAAARDRRRSGDYPPTGHA